MNLTRRVVLPLAAIAAVLFIPTPSNSQEQKPAPEAAGQAAPQTQQKPKPEIQVTEKAIAKIRQAFAQQGVDGVLRLGVLGGRLSVGVRGPGGG